MLVTIHNSEDRKVIYVSTKNGAFQFDCQTKELTRVSKPVGFHLMLKEEPEDLVEFLTKVFSPNVGEIFNENHGLKRLPMISPRYSSQAVFFWITSENAIFANCTSNLVTKTKPESGDVRRVSLEEKGEKIAVIGSSGVGKTYLTHLLFKREEIFETDSCKKEDFLEKYQSQKIVVIGQRDETFDLSFVENQLQETLSVMEIRKCYNN